MYWLQFSGDSAYMGSDGQRDSNSSQQRSSLGSLSASGVLAAVEEAYTKPSTTAAQRISNDTAKARSSAESKDFIQASMLIDEDL